MINPIKQRLEITPLISIIIPVIRPKNMPRLMRLIQQHAGVSDKLYEILTAEDKDRIGCPKMVKAMTDQSRGQMVMFLGDDTLPWKNFLKYAIEAMATLPDGWGLVGLNDQHHDGNELATHWMAHKAMLPYLGGEFFHTGYRHCFCDQELNHRAKEMGRYVWADKAKIKHCNPIIDDKYDLDDDYQRVYSKEIFEADKLLFLRRKENGWKTPGPVPIAPGRRPPVAIGVPSYRFGEKQFWACLKEMRSYSLAYGIHTVCIKPRGSIIHNSRNKIAFQVRRDYPQCSNLMMIDDDMIFPPDTLVKMLAHEKEFVSCNAYRKVPPYAPIAQIWNTESDSFNTIHIDPAHGKLRRISTIGTGLVLVKMSVFEKINFPWFEFSYAWDPQNHHAIEGYVLIGEDLNFCFKMADNGIGVYCDFSINVGHILVEQDECGHETRRVIDWRTHEEAWEKLEQQSGQESSVL